MIRKRNTSSTGGGNSGRARARQQGAPMFESLEGRRLMATVSVTNFGARPGDGLDDTLAVKAAIAASLPGDTIRFSGGTFDLPNGVTITGNGRTYVGDNGASVRGAHAEGWLFRAQQDNTTVRGLTFKGGGLFVERLGGGKNQNIVIDFNVFHLNTDGEMDHGVTFTNGLANSRITNNYFTNYTGGFAIYGYDYDGLTIANNEVVNCVAGFHIDSFAGSGSRNLLVEQNYITGAKGMGMEFQGTATDLVFQDNFFENPNLSPNVRENDNSIAFSLPLDKSTNITIRRNTVKTPQKPDGVGCRLGFELGGDNTVCEDNYVDGADVTAYASDADGTCSVTVRNNRFRNYKGTDYLAYPAEGRSYTSYNNGPNVALTWNINRPRPNNSGDADFDGDVDGVDVSLWAANFTGELSGTGTMLRSQGDWDYDGDVDGIDVGLWAMLFTGELGGSGSGVMSPATADAIQSALKSRGVTDIT